MLKKMYRESREKQGTYLGKKPPQATPSRGNLDEDLLAAVGKCMGSSFSSSLPINIDVIQWVFLLRYFR